MGAVEAGDEIPEGVLLVEEADRGHVCHYDRVWEMCRILLIKEI